MKAKIVLAISGILAMGLFPGCQDVYQPSYSELKSDLATAQKKIAGQEAKLAELEEKWELQQATANETQREIEAYQDKIDSLGKALNEKQAEIAVTEESPAPPPPEPTPLQEENFRYVDTIDNFISIHVTMVKATWAADNTVTVSWELTNTSNGKILLNLLAVKARDQWWNKGAFAGQRVQFKDWGESGFLYEEDPVAICPTLQSVEKAWPGQTIPFDVKWKFGPLSEVITIEFLVFYSPVREDDVPIKVVELNPELKPAFILTRPSTSAESP